MKGIQFIVDVTGNDSITLPPNTATTDDCRRIAALTGVNPNILIV